jgi:hypothetical protein
MHCELLLPGLLRVADFPRVPSLELLLARGRATHDEAQSMEAWLQASFEMAQLPAGALTVLAEEGEPGDASWVRADPVHLQLLRDRAVVVPGEALAISSEEAQALIASLNAHFAGRLALRAATPLRWSARAETPLQASGQPALESAGSAAAPARQGDALLTELQMALHAHPVNEAREARGEPAINSLWLWGSGSLPGAGELAPARWQSITADDPLVRGLARAAQVRSRSASGGASWLARSPEDGRHLVVLDVLRPFAALSDPAGFSASLQALEREWFAPLLAALRTARIGMVTVHAPDGERALSVEAVRGDLRRIWRRPRQLSAWIG